MNSERFKQLAKQFLERTRQEVTEFDAALPQARNNQAQALTTLLHVAHRVHGSGAMLGFKPISTAAGRVEQLLLDARSASTEVDWQALEAALVLLKTELVTAENAHD